MSLPEVASEALVISVVVNIEGKVVGSGELVCSSVGNVVVSVKIVSSVSASVNVIVWTVGSVSSSVSSIVVENSKVVVSTVDVNSWKCNNNRNKMKGK